MSSMASRRDEPLRAVRIADGRFPLLDGAGAARHGARWSSPGHRAIYASLTYAGALLELLTRLRIGKVPSEQQCIVIDVPARSGIEVVDADKLPSWASADTATSRAFGDRWLEERRTAGLVVPSVVGHPHERNVVINQDHPRAGLITASRPQPVAWDERLFL